MGIEGGGWGWDRQRPGDDGDKPRETEAERAARWEPVDKIAAANDYVKKMREWAAQDQAAKLAAEPETQSETGEDTTESDRSAPDRDQPYPTADHDADKPSDSTEPDAESGDHSVRDEPAGGTHDAGADTVRDSAPPARELPPESSPADREQETKRPEYLDQDSQSEGTDDAKPEGRIDQPDEARSAPVEGSDNTPLARDHYQTRPRLEWREGDPPIDTTSEALANRDMIIYVRPERRDNQEANSGLGGPEAPPIPELGPVEHQARIDVMRREAGDVMSLPPGKGWSNSKYAGQTFELSSDLIDRFPDQVQFSDEGFPMFDRYAAKTVVFEEGFRGPGRKDDFDRANAVFGWNEVPDGMVWHHREDGKTLILIDYDLHSEARHWGGVAVSKGMGLWEGR